MDGNQIRVVEFLCTVSSKIGRQLSKNRSETLTKLFLTCHHTKEKFSPSLKLHFLCLDKSKISLPIKFQARPVWQKDVVKVPNIFMLHNIELGANCQQLLDFNLIFSVWAEI